MAFDADDRTRPPSHALIDRDLYVQADWFDDPARMATAGFPKDHAFATKPALALAQAKRALTAGIRPKWATGDEVYGRSRELREFLEGAGIGYVFAVPVDHQLTTFGGGRMRADQALHLVEPDGRNRRSCGAGAKGPRYYDWAWIATDHPRRDDQPLRRLGPDHRYRRTALRCLTQTRHRHPSHPDTTSSTLSQRDKARDEAGPGPGALRGRTWGGWHHHVTLVSVAQAFCTLQRLARAPEDGASLSLYQVVHEIQTLLATWTGGCPTCHRDIPTRTST